MKHPRLAVMGLLTVLAGWKAGSAGTGGAVPDAWPHAPPGWRVLADQPADAPVPAVDDGKWVDQWGVSWNEEGNVTTVRDRTGPSSPGSVLQYRYPAGFEGGRGPGMVYRGLNGARSVYFAMWWKVSRPWQGHLTGSNKIAYLMTNSQGSVTLIMQQRPSGERYELWVYPQFSTSREGWLKPNVGNPAVTLGDWHLIEWIVEYDSGEAGRIRWWLDGQPVGDHAGLRFPSETLVEAQVSSVWGGLGDRKRQTDFYWFDHLHIRTP